MHDFGPFIIDASVTIDYLNSVPEIIKNISTNLAPIYISRPTFEQVKQLSLKMCKSLRLSIAEPDRDDLERAATGRSSLAFDDKITILLAAENLWCCITSDKRMRQECIKVGIETLWGLEPLKLLINTGFLSCKGAITAAKLIQQSNPKYITDDIIGRFITNIQQD